MNNATPAQVSPAINSSAAQRSAAQCGRCCDVRRGAIFWTFSSSSTRYDTGTRFIYALCTRLFAFFSLLFSLGPHATPSPANSIRTAVQNVSSTSTQHSAGQLALHKHLLALLSIRYLHQIIAGLFFLHSLHMFSLHCTVRDCSGRRQSPAERSPVLFLGSHRVP